jgi:tetratricopeptide (TPR) repeat protein
MSRFESFIILVCLAVHLAVVAETGRSSEAIAAIEAALRAGNFSNALQLAQSELQHSPQNKTLWALKGVALARLGHDKEALAAYNRALGMSPDYLAALEGAAELEYKTGSRRAVVLLSRITKLRPDDPTTHAMLGVLAYKQHQCDSAVAHFRASRQLINSQPLALEDYGSCLIEMQQAGNAISVFQQIQGLQPDNPHARYNLAVAQLSAHQAKDAIATLQPLLQMQPQDPDILGLASSAYEETGDTPQAVSLLRQAIAINPTIFKYYVDFAALSFNHQSFQVGIDMINAGLKQIPTAAPLYVVRGILLIQLGQFENGEADFAVATRLDPGQTAGAVAEGLALLQQSNLEQALATVSSQLKTHPKDAFLQYLQAQILLQQGPDPESPQFKEAVAAAVLSTQLNPDFVLARDLLGNLYLKAGQIDKSIEQSRRALQQSPSDQEAVYHLIQALRHNGKDKKAELPALVACRGEAVTSHRMSLRLLERSCGHHARAACRPLRHRLAVLPVTNSLRQATSKATCRVAATIAY